MMLTKQLGNAEGKSPSMLPFVNIFIANNKSVRHIVGSCFYICVFILIDKLC